MTRFEGKVAVVTGGASGLGLAVTRQLLGEGARVVVVDWDDGNLDAARSELGRSTAPCTVLKGDVAQAATAGAAVEAARSGWGRLDVLFNNAGIDPLQARSVLETDERDWDRILEVNVKSAYLMSRAAIPLMREGGGGSIVNTASIAGLKAAGGETAYSVSKAAMVSLTQALAVDFAADGIRANCVCPGFMEMVMTDRRRDLSAQEQEARGASAAARIPLGRQGTYEEVAKVVLFLAGPDSSYVTGTSVVVDGGLLLR